MSFGARKNIYSIFAAYQFYLFFSIIIQLEGMVLGITAYDIELQSDFYKIFFPKLS